MRMYNLEDGKNEWNKAFSAVLVNLKSPVVGFSETKYSTVVFRGSK